MRSLTFLWIVVGLITLFSASLPEATQDFGDGLYFVKRQVIWLSLGFIAMAAIVQVPMRIWLRLAPAGYCVVLLMVVLTHMPGLGVTRLDATRWLMVAGLPIQPSELLKPMLVLQASVIFGYWQQWPPQRRLLWLGLFAWGLAAVLTQPALSTTIVCGLTLWLIALVADMPRKILMSFAAVGAMGATISVLLKPYQMLRLLAFVDPWNNTQGIAYQLVQSLIAVGSGGLWGRGFGMSQQKLYYLPIQSTDFIFSVYAEEFGLIGSLALLAFLGFYAHVCLRVARQCQRPDLRCVAYGCMCLLVGQALINIGVASGMLPTTGLPLPLFSYGGSSILASMLAAAFLMRTACDAQRASQYSSGSVRAR